MRNLVFDFYEYYVYYLVLEENLGSTVSDVKLWWIFQLGTLVKEIQRIYFCEEWRYPSLSPWDLSKCEANRIFSLVYDLPNIRKLPNIS